MLLFLLNGALLSFMSINSLPRFFSHFYLKKVACQQGLNFKTIFEAATSFVTIQLNHGLVQQKYLFLRIMNKSRALMSTVISIDRKNDGGFILINSLFSNMGQFFLHKPTLNVARLS